MATAVDNPFVITGYISPEYFCDREEETAQLVSYIKNGHNIALISGRRMGKTGLIEHVFNQPKISNSYYTFLIDIYSAQNLREFVLLLGKEIFERLKPRGQKFVDKFFATVSSLRVALRFDELTGSPEFNIELGKIKYPETSLDQIFRYLETADRRCILAIDEFQQVAKFTEKNVEAILRTHIQHFKNTNLIFAGSVHHMMRDIFFSHSRPFYQSTTPMVIGAIDKKKYIAFVSRFFKTAGIGIADDVIGDTYDWFEGHTWYMQRVFNEIWIHTSRGDIVDHSTISGAIERIAESYGQTYHNISIGLSERQKEVLIAIAKESKATEITSGEFIETYGLQSPSSVQTAVRQLVAREIVNKDQKTYYVADRFFGVWLILTYGRGHIVFA
jgi:AAA+ ATPase superfamily predicted ATPase